MMIRPAIAVALAISLGGCAHGVLQGVLIGLEVISSTTSIAKNVVGIDVSLRQDDKTKTPIKTLVSPPTPVTVGGSASAPAELPNLSLDGK